MEYISMIISGVIGLLISIIGFVGQLFGIESITKYVDSYKSTIAPSTQHIDQIITSSSTQQAKDQISAKLQKIIESKNYTEWKTTLQLAGVEGTWLTEETFKKLSDTHALFVAGEELKALTSLASLGIQESIQNEPYLQFILNAVRAKEPLQ